MAQTGVTPSFQEGQDRLEAGVEPCLTERFVKAETPTGSAELTCMIGEEIDLKGIRMAAETTHTDDAVHLSMDPINKGLPFPMAVIEAFHFVSLQLV